ncbi:hypothetical protein Belba_1952 [Belliella baltica DSM 15883]|uniref:Uncharacterized protein n=1 Tax=Belliella baltica (strain DSM 15883 / CIP 108006 / LMG 21964 / BA134) TaxID=866536 RepID=I3Z5L1_BELBD|nr:hypothetical protein [Belliella baltica]AFL84529.1 hypothetical protein Belba_1952 [Belliella baltica DSM 15883]
MLKNIFKYQVGVFDFLDEHWEGAVVSKLISNIVLSFFIFGLVVGLLNYLGVIFYSDVISPFFAIELAL